MTRSALSSLASRFLWLPLALACAGSVCAADTDDGFPLIAQALQARSHLIFTARQDILWTTTPTGSAAVQIVTDIVQNGRRARMTYRFPSEAAGRVMVDDGVHASLYDPAHHTLLVGQTQTEDALTAAAVPTLLRRNYRCLRLRRETVNGCLCDVVALRPRTPLRCSKTVWIDRVHHAILRAEEYDGDGNRRYVSSYETIVFARHLPSDALAFPPAAAKAARRQVKTQTVAVTNPARALALAGVPGRLPAWLPPGYVLLRCAVVRMNKAAPCVLLRYGDGLKTLTVFEQVSEPSPSGEAAPANSLARWGQRAWTRRDGSVSSVVRGDVALSPALGAELIRALAPNASAILQRAVRQDFGPSAANLATDLRRRGWGFVQIGALCLLRKEKPQSQKRIQALLTQGRSWTQLAASMGADALESRGRAWVASSLAAGPKHERKNKK
ncbi:MAG: hypothetical protein M3Y28_05410 [Armatimonadota bacterium]|nr:hypothetical protein [Armatimonadota bacterium]